MAHNVSKTILHEAKSPQELLEFLAEHAARYQAETEIEHPAYQLQLLIEFHEKTGYWILYSQRVLKPDFGGQVYQEQTREHLFAVHEASVKRGQDMAKVPDTL